MRTLTTLFILSIAFSFCNEPVATEPPPADPPSLSQKVKLNVEGEPCIDSELVVTCNKNSTSGSGSELYSSETTYFYSTRRSILYPSSCFTRPVELKLTWSGPIPPSSFNYTLSNVDELYTNSNIHSFNVDVSIIDTSGYHYSSLWYSHERTPAEVLDPNASSNFSYSITDSICDLRTTSTLILDGNYSGYLYTGNHRNADSLYVVLDVKELLIGHLYY